MNLSKYTQYFSETIVFIAVHDILHTFPNPVAIMLQLKMLVGTAGC